MAHESFEDLEIGGVLSREWIKSTVDREERPDVDAVDMTIVQLANRGHGGWPMTILMDDALRPLSAATYLPVRDGDRGGRAGLLGILTSFAAGDRPGDPQLERRAATIVQALRVHEGRRAEDLGEASRGDEHAGIANEAAYAAIAPPCRGKAIAEGASAAWVCRERTRSRPITSTAA
jgi:uncharacterized protein YyaL (SSP411 family)